MAKLQLVQDPAADALLESDPFALLVGMLVDQQVTIRLRAWLSKSCALSLALASRSSRDRRRSRI